MLLCVVKQALQPVPIACAGPGLIIIRGAVTAGRVRVWFKADRLLYRLHYEVNMMRFEI
jgi:hypothetical protein